MINVKRYKHKVQYYETDQMGVVHHSNYIRWFEESRVDLLEQIGFGYHRMEEMGIISPVLSVAVDYIHTSRFSEEVFIIPKITYFNGLKFTVSYEVRNVVNDELKTTGETKHCFLGNDFKPINIKKVHRDLYDLFMELCEK